MTAEAVVAGKRQADCAGPFVLNAPGLYRRQPLWGRGASKRPFHKVGWREPSLWAGGEVNSCPNCDKALRRAREEPIVLPA